MIDGGNLIEREDLRKVVNRKKGVRRERTGRKERQGCENFSWLARHFPDAYAYHRCLRVRASLTQSAAIKLLFPTLEPSRNLGDFL